MEKTIYELVEWPDIQTFMEDYDYKDRVGFDTDKNVWFVPEDMIKKHEIKEKNAHKTFKPFQKVLVKVTNDDDNDVWVAAIYSHYNEAKGRHYFSNMQWTDDDSGIIPFEGNEDKLGQIAE